MQNKTVAKLMTASFIAGSTTMYCLLYEWHQKQLKFLGIAYQMAYDELKILKGEIDE